MCARPACGAPQPARPVPVLADPWPGVPIRGRGALAMADACWLPVAQGLTPHGLRHTYKTLMIELGTPATLMDAQMGHEDGSDAMLVLVWYGRGEDLTLLAAGFAVSRATAYRYRDEGHPRLSATAPDLHDALRRHPRRRDPEAVAGLVLPGRVGPDRSLDPMQARKAAFESKAKVDQLNLAPNSAHAHRARRISYGHSS